jgi:hypothetical protein
VFNLIEPALLLSLGKAIRGIEAAIMVRCGGSAKLKTI